MAEPKTYLERISVSKEKKDQAELVQVAEDAGIQVQADISSAKKAKREAERELASAETRQPFDSAEYVQAKRAVKEATEDLQDLEALRNDLFPSAGN